MEKADKCGHRHPHRGGAGHELGHGVPHPGPGGHGGDQPPELALPHPIISMASVLGAFTGFSGEKI